MTAVLDSSVIVACALDEPGGSGIADRLSGSLLGSVNAAEVVSRLRREGFALDEIREGWVQLGVVVVDFDEGLAVIAGELEASTRRKGLSLGDRACLALAKREGLPVLTADRVWADVDVGVEIELIR